MDPLYGLRVLTEWTAEMRINQNNVSCAICELTSDTRTSHDTICTYKINISHRFRHLYWRLMTHTLLLLYFLISSIQHLIPWVCKFKKLSRYTNPFQLYLQIIFSFLCRRCGCNDHF